MEYNFNHILERVTPRPRLGRRPRVPGCDGAGTVRGATPHPRSGGRLGGATPRPHAQGQGRRPGGRPHIQGAMAAWAQEGLEELSHVEGQEGRR